MRAVVDTIEAARASVAAPTAACADVAMGILAVCVRCERRETATLVSPVV